MKSTHDRGQVSNKHQVNLQNKNRKSNLQLSRMFSFSNFEHPPVHLTCAKFNYDFHLYTLYFHGMYLMYLCGICLSKTENMQGALEAPFICLALKQA